ncbi:hypothetical protein [Streptococcus oralis]|uniref:Pre-toxin TG domain-containing protein n=1 Tax=Streptococcus oralis TaxID=1303 RepID=A0AAW7W8Q6_STROR|nr:hypothetical protein [Streptococcus oralis]ATF56044.1 hypothetical protein CO686_00755 [Streptococcus oralis]MBR8667317.1 hypothetical protein [Streptococcus oralis]MCB7108230.1 hypothetical protein [Streptococcus oralis]MCQ5169549.1 hypothetical protein [Streptococcus oralis]MDO6344216.1 hypothetical protein [Streptococcus oralis]
MTKYYSNKPDFPGDPAYPLISSSSYFKSMSDIMDDIEAAGKVVTDEGVEDLYVQNGEASLGTTKDSAIFDKSMKRIYSMLTSAKKIHSDIMQNIDSKFTKGMDAAFVTLNDVNGANKPYKSKYTKQTVPKKVLAGYKADGTSVYIDTTEQKSYTLSEILDGKASPIQAAKDVYDDRIKAVKEMMAKKDQLSDEQIKALEGKSAEEIVAVRYPGQLPDYQRLKASRYYEENKESLQYVDMALKVVAFLGMAGGAILAPATGGTSLTVSYASMAYLAADSAYSAFNGHTMITGNQLSTEDRVWAGIDAAVTLVSMGSAGYLAKLAKSGKNGSTLLKGLATAGKHADDVNDVSKVIYSFATDQDPNAALQNLVLGQVMGLGMNSAGNYIGKKFGTPAVDLPGAKASHLDVSLQGKQIPKLDPANVRLSSRPDLHLKASPADTTLAKLKTHPTVSADVPKIKQVSGDSATKAIGGVKPGDVDVPKVKGTANPSPSQSTTQAIIDQKLKEYGVSWDEFNRLRNTRITEMSQYEYDMMIDIRKSIPNPTEQTVLQKIIPVENADNYFGDKGWGVGGFISKRGDVVDIKTIEDAVNGLRLDYENSPFVETMIDANGKRVAVRDQNGNLKLKTDAFVRIEFRTHDTDYIDIPIGNRDGTKLDADPASGNGFIKSDEYLIPEYKIVDPDTQFPSVKLTDGSKMYLNVGGEEVLVGVVKNGKMYYVEG